MTRIEVGNQIHSIIQDAVQRSRGNWRHSYKNDVEKIFTVMGKLTPEPKVKPEVPKYNPKKVKRVGTIIQRYDFTDEQRTAAVAALRAVGLL